MITTILTAYNRGYTLLEQIDAIRNQTIKSERIIVLYNKGTEPQIQIDMPDIDIMYLNFNTKFHGRFAISLLARTEYVAIFDDDTIPGNRWFETCISEMNKQPGIYGSVGVIMRGQCYNPHDKVGHNGMKSDQSTKVDLVGHSWFFKKMWAKYMWYEDPASWDNGEDMQFSYLCQKYGNINTYVSPYPKDDKSVWGSLKGEEYGNDDMASYKLNNHRSLRNDISKEYISRGWSIINGHK